MTTEITRDSDQFHVYRYGVSIRYIPPKAGEDEEINLGRHHTELRVVKDYDAQVMPYFRLHAVLSQRDVQRIRETWKEGRLFITIAKFRVDRGDEKDAEVDTGEFVMKDEEFKIMLGDMTPATTRMDDAGTQAMQLPTVEFPMEIAPILPLAINKAVSPEVFHDVTINDVVVSLIERHAPRGADYKFAMSPSDNPRRYETLMIPPLNFTQAMRYVDDVYGIYKGRLSVFMDTHRAYVTSSTKVTKNPPSIKATAVSLEVISAQAAGEAAASGSGFDAESRVIRLRTSSKVEVDASGPARSEVDGKSIQLVNTSFETNTELDCGSWAVDEENDKTGAASDEERKRKVFWQNYDNPLTGDRMKILARENYAPAVVQADGFDVAALEPTLLWRLLTSNDSTAVIEGNWKLRAAELVFTKQKDSGSTSSLQAMLKLVPATNET